MRIGKADLHYDSSKQWFIDSEREEGPTEYIVLLWSLLKMADTRRDLAMPLDGESNVAGLRMLDFLVLDGSSFAGDDGTTVSSGLSPDDCEPRRRPEPYEM